MIAINEAGIRDKVKCMFGGAPVSQSWIDEIGADGTAENAAAAVLVADKLMVGDKAAAKEGAKVGQKAKA